MTWIDELTAKIPDWEYTVPWLYLDNAEKPNATTAQGFLVASLPDSLKLPWRNPDGVALATTAAVALDWNRVTAMRGGMMAVRYKAPSSLLLAGADIEALTRGFVAASYGEIKGLFPAFDSYPLPAQVAVGDMAYNPGVGRLKSGYPHFCGAVLAEDWSLAAQHCGRNSWMAAFKARNAWTVSLFQQAAALAGSPNAKPTTVVQLANLTVPQ